MDEHSARLVKMIEDACHRFRSGELTLTELQTTVEGVASALERTAGSTVLEGLRRFIASLEHIYFMCQPEEQREKVDREIDSLLHLIMMTRRASGNQDE
ncbi:MAG: hypothetical protein H5U08_00190 [Thermogutta sp.]|uniref:hypothetical protein n=1 Tax=Thermogutta sp. TaxID=1962930 RepID=UPI0019B3A55D|nr:hypothetical protein [Thermogutta sp.]MBC7350753.1 hypothetical protein [Thermogutta sp.]